MDMRRLESGIKAAKHGVWRPRMRVCRDPRPVDEGNGVQPSTNTARAIRGHRREMQCLCGAVDTFSIHALSRTSLSEKPDQNWASGGGGESYLRAEWVPRRRFYGELLASTGHGSGNAIAPIPG